MDKLQSAQLQVVLPGTRASFRRRVIDAMSSLVPAAGAFFFFGKEDSRAYSDATRVVDGTAQALPQVLGGAERPRLSTALGYDPERVVLAPRRAYGSEELWRGGERAGLPYFRDVSWPDGFMDVVVLFLHEGGVLFGVAGLERREGEPPFTDGDRALLEELAPFVVAGARAQLQYDELAREAAVLRALGRTSGGALYVVDRERGRVLWAVDRDRGIDWEEDVEPFEEQLVSAVQTFLEAASRDDALPTPPRLPMGTIVSVVRLDGDPLFGVARCAAVRVERPAKPAPMEGLSKREREIARLLVAGYSGVNVAAISGLSENTVRTYVRRLYAKLDVNNRADLVRRLMTPASSEEPASQIAPPPDSSLATGDDTLD